MNRTGEEINSGLGADKLHETGLASPLSILYFGASAPQVNTTGSWAMSLLLPSHREYVARINAAVEHINAHPAEDLSLAALARVSCFSPFHFHRIFTAYVGETPTDFVRRTRLQRAAGMLRNNPGSSVTAIAFDNGFSSPAVFSRAFRDHFGISPSAWRGGKGALRRPGSKNRKIRKGVSKQRKASLASPTYFDPDVQTTGNQRGPAMTVTIRDLPQKRVAYVANLGGYKAHLIKAAWDRLCAWAGPLGLLAPPAEAIGMSFDDPEITPADKCRYYACITIPAGTTPPRDIGTMVIPAGRCAVMPFDGMEHEIKTAYKELYGTWLPQSGFQPEDRPCFEVYHATPDVDPEGRFVMDICMPVRPL